ncbi:hypothetical protein SAMN05216298_4973 [Glycomyces sambucus]|uniref:Uncharacterized protein n=1 Tax=Glycomyces sambucus TaxID=380244 RepID=A0A1G9MH90_9ACTN|nr:hypothetical protein [Glycomyces sambucus]SDL73589.1 hypothetical protein SAMN05216298_4973 [Glycomyces sambucus]
MCKPQHRTRVVLDESEIQRRLTRPKPPTLAERYAQAATPDERDRFYSNEIRRSEPAPPRSTGRPPSTVWVTKPILKTRGWTDAAIREFLPRPERHYSNPHVQGRRPMPIWSARTVGRIEATDEWRLWLAQSLARRNTTLRELAESIREHAFRHRAKTADSAIAHYRDARFKASR